MKKRKVFGKHILRNIDWVLVALVLGILFLGIVAITSATSPAYDPDTMTFGEYLGTLDWSYGSLQLVFFGMGLVAVVVMMMMDYNNLRDFSDIIYWVAVALLIAVKIFGREVNGTAGWFRIGSRGIQPAELCKVAIIIVFAKEFAQRTEGRGGIQHVRDLIPMLWRFIIPFVLILAQPDFGSAIVYAVVLFGLMFMAKTNWKIVLGVFGAVVAVLPLGWLMLADYQKNRLLSFVDPELDPTGAGYQLLRAKVVGSSGGLKGKGLFSADLLTQKTNYLPEEQTDFIFAATTEAVGFIGGMVIILLYGLLIYRLISLSMKAKDDFGAYLILGVSFMLLFHVVENIGMNIGAMPVTGIPLPLFSYGGSNLLTMMLAFGLVLNVNARRLRYTL